MKEIKIVTYCTYKSLGSILQAYGLQKQINELGYKTTLIMDINENIYHEQKIESFKGLCKSVFGRIVFQRKKSAYQKRISFIEEHINIKYFNEYRKLVLSEKKDSSNIYLAGSDQIWHPDNCNPLFFLDFVKNGKCVSYAASMGKTIIKIEKQKLFQEMISNFDFVSVREDECVDAIKTMIDKKIEVHIDPTFLISVNEWRKTSKPYNVKVPYILAYMLYWDEACKNKIKSLKKQTGFCVFAIADDLSRVYADKVFYDVGVEEFLWLIDHAEYVITSSFHGVAFSTIFNKKFSAIINPKAPSRIENLLRKLSLPLVDINDLPTSNAFDYFVTNQLIVQERERSIGYLKRILE